MDRAITRSRNDTGLPAELPFPAGTGGRRQGDAPTLSILIVNYNSTALLRQCLDSIRDSTIAGATETIVVDNASRDFDLPELQNAYPWARWLPQSTNTGFTAATNTAFRSAAGKYLLMLNPDTVLEGDALEVASRHLHLHRDVAALGPYFIGPDGGLQRIYRRLPGARDIACLLFEPIFRRTRTGRRFLMSEESFEDTTDVGHSPAAFCMLRRTAVGDTLLDPGYYNMVSDLDLSRRLLRQGGRIQVNPSVRCHHVGGGAGLGTRDPRVQLRLHEDYVWGLRRFYRSHGLAARLILNALIPVYWVTRIAHVGRRGPRVLPAALASAARSLSGQPPWFD